MILLKVNLLLGRIYIFQNIGGRTGGVGGGGGGNLPPRAEGGPPIPHPNKLSLGHFQAEGAV